MPRLASVDGVRGRPSCPLRVSTKGNSLRTALTNIYTYQEVLPPAIKGIQRGRSIENRAGGGEGGQGGGTRRFFSSSSSSSLHSHGDSFLFPGYKALNSCLIPRSMVMMELPGTVQSTVRRPSRQETSCVASPRTCKCNSIPR